MTHDTSKCTHNCGPACLVLRCLTQHLCGNQPSVRYPPGPHRFYHLLELLFLAYLGHIRELRVHHTSHGGTDPITADQKIAGRVRAVFECERDGATSGVMGVGVEALGEMKDGGRILDVSAEQLEQHRTMESVDCP